MLELNTGVHTGVAGAIEELRGSAPRPASRRACRARTRAGCVGDLADGGARGAARDAVEAAPGFRGLRRPFGAAPALLRPPRPRRRREPRGVHVAARGRPALAPARARAVGQLAVRRRRGDRARLDARRAADAAPPRGRARLPLRTTRPGRPSPSGSSSSGSPTTYAALVGRAAAPAPGHARDPHARPADRPSRRRPASPRSPQALSPAEPAQGHADRGVYAQNRWAAARFGAAAGLVHPDDAVCSPRELLAELLGGRIEPVARDLGSAGVLAARRPRPGGRTARDRPWAGTAGLARDPACRRVRWAVMASGRRRCR